DHTLVHSLIKTPLSATREEGFRFSCLTAALLSLRAWLMARLPPIESLQSPRSIGGGRCPGPGLPGGRCLRAPAGAPVADGRARPGAAFGAGAVRRRQGSGRPLPRGRPARPRYGAAWRRWSLAWLRGRP